MLKRITKMTSLLVCFASVASIIPAYAADVKKIDATNGTIYNARAKGAGIFIDGEINDKDEAQYFISTDGKYNEISGLDNGDAAQDLLLNKYLEIDDDTMVDITNNYKVIDNNTRADLEDDVATTLRKKIKNDDDGRFDKNTFESSNIIKGGKFLAAGSGLSVFKYNLKSPSSTKNSDAIYSDYAGNYVDADYNLGNLKVTTTGDSVIIKNTKDIYEIKKNDEVTYEVRAEISEDSTNKYITDISDYIYRFANLTIYERRKGDTAWTPATSEYGFGGPKYKVTNSGSVVVLQKFSKTAASEKVDGINYSKDSAIYFLKDEDGKDEVILGQSAASSATKVGGTATGAKVKITCNAQGFCSAFLDVNDKKIYGETLKLKTKDGFNYVDLGDTDSTDTDLVDSIYTSGGFVWVLDKGYVKAWDGNESFAKVYKVDGSMNNMSIGSKDVMVLWNEDDSVYSVINNSKTDKAVTTGAAVITDTTKVNSSGWVKAADGAYTFINTDGVKAINWKQDGAYWYYLNPTIGTMTTGWQKVNGTWYYLNPGTASGPLGSMQTGWINDKGTWYYCDGTGAMLSNTTVGGYVLGSNGAWIG